MESNPCRNSETSANGKVSAVVRAIAARVLFYGTIAVIAWRIAGLPSLRWTSSAAPQRHEGSSAADPGWPHIRGAKFDAVSINSTLADSWPAEGPPVLWSCEFGLGYSGLIAVGDRVYTQVQTLTDQKVVALDADTGHTIWERSYAWPYDPGGMYPGPRATPALAGDGLYFAGPDGTVGRLRAEDGQPVWTRNVLRQFNGRGADFGYACSPLVEDGKVILPVGGPGAAVVALNAENGEKVWASGDAAASYCSALPISFIGRRQVIAFLKNELAGFDLPSGRLLWHKSYSSGYDEHAAFPIYSEPFLRTMQPFRAGSDLYRLEAETTAGHDPVQPGSRLDFVRHDPHMSNDVASSVLVAGYVYGFDLSRAQTNPQAATHGVFRCIDFKTGQIQWSSDQPGHASIAVSGDHLLLLNDRGELILARANPRRYEELARTSLFRGEICWTAPAIDRDRAYLRSPTRIACVYVGQRAGLGDRQARQAVPASAISQGSRMELSWLIGGEREHPFELPDFGELRGWYLLSLAVLAVSGAAAGCVGLVFWLLSRRWAGIAAKCTFWASLPVLGIAATPWANHFWQPFLFTWPVSLLAAHQLALAANMWAGQPGRSHGASWCGRLAAAGLIVAFVGYYALTRRLSLAPAWYFLPTLVVAWPLAIPAAQRLSRSLGFVGDMAWMLITFFLYFWTTAGLMLWRGAQ
jgi:hypothetical protein